MPLTIPPAERAQYHRVWQRLTEARDILLVSPQRPDGDSVGSILALRAALATVGKDATAFCPDPIPPTLSGIPGSHAVTIGVAALRGRTFDVIVVCDAGDLAYTGVADELPTWKRSNGALIAIDHHATNTGYGDLPCIVPTAASTTEVLFRVLAENSIPLTAEIATCLLFGLVTDTDGFTNPATSASALATAAALTAAGARIGPILRDVYRTKPIDALRLWGKAFERLRMHPRYGVAATVLLPEDFQACADGAERSEGLSNFLQAVVPARAILVLKDDGSGTVRGSLRTQRNDVDVGALAERLGGGGHRKASGFGIAGKIVRDGERWTVV